MMRSELDPMRCRFQPAKRLSGLSPYEPPAKSTFVDLFLDANEGRSAVDTLGEILAGFDGSELCRYPSTVGLERMLADKFGIASERVVVTNGGDDAIDRVCRVALEPGRELLVHTPTFEMIERSARLAGGSVRSVAWLGGQFPASRFAGAISPETSLVALVSPNNPTGGVISRGDMQGVIEAARRVGALVMVDLAYVEFADEDPTLDLLDEPNVVLIRTFSKAMGLAGARVGYALASPAIAGWLRTVGGPYPVSSVSAALAARALGAVAGRREYIEMVRSEREELSGLLQGFGFEVLGSKANFVTANFNDAALVQRSLASLGIAVRAFPARPELDGFLRITLPGDRAAFERLLAAMRTILTPEAIPFDLDGLTLEDNGAADRRRLPGRRERCASRDATRLGRGVDRQRHPDRGDDPMSSRTATIQRTTRETRVEATLDLDGTGQAAISTGLGFLDHMLIALATHAQLDIELSCTGDLDVDDHHTVEDCAIVLGEAVFAAIGQKRGIRRFASAYAPLDESLARVVVDISGRPFAGINLGLRRDAIGSVSCENIGHFFVSFAMAARLTLHVDVLRGENDHHRAEAAFKALALALREAVTIDAGCDEIPSTKGVL